MPKADTPVSIVIPTFNGLDILKECLPSVVAEIGRRGMIDELLIMDNAGTDGTAEFIASEYPWARVLRLERNAAIFAMNRAARATSLKYMFFLNNDMLLEEGCVDALLEKFEDDVFAVTGKVFQWDRSTVQAGRRRAVFARGMFWYLPWPGEDAPGITLHALGGQSIYDREKFLELDGFDPLFSPFYHEDLDISWRAYRRGWRVLYEPSAVMIHRGAATAVRLYTRAQLDSFMAKNVFLFIWKNLHGPGMLREHFIWLPLRLAKAALKGDKIFLSGFLGALKQSVSAARCRSRARATARIGDGQVLELLGPGAERSS